MFWLWRNRQRTNPPAPPINLAILEGKVNELLKQQRTIMADLTRLNAAVSANTTAVADVTTVVNDLKSATDQTGIDAAAAQIEANNTALEALKPAPAPEPAPVTP